MYISTLSRVVRPMAMVFLLVSVLKVNAQSHTPKYQSIISNSKAFYEYLPQGYNSNETYPLIVFLHGVGELGDGSPNALNTVLKNGLPRVINEGKFPTSFNTNGRNYRFIVISPEFVSWPNANDVQGVIDYAVRNYRVDQTRIYVTGLSMGGGATWDYAGASISNASRIAALVPVCGASEPDPLKSYFMATASLPIWALHNDGDPQVPVWNTNQFINLINALFPNPLARKTIFHSTDHDAWSVSFNPDYRENGMNIYEWMLQYSRGNGNSGQAPVNQQPSAYAGDDASITLPTNSVTVSGNGSDPDGSITSYSWVLLSGPTQPSIVNSNTSKPSFTNLSAGEYVFRLTVTDNSGSSAYDDMMVRVNNNSSIVSPPSNNDSYSGSTLSIPGRIESENYSAMSGIANESTSDNGGGLNVGYINGGDWFDYKVNVQTSGTYLVNFRVATAYINQIFQIKNASGNVLASVDVPRTGGFQTWTTFSINLNLSAGEQVLRIYSLTEFWNINWMSFEMNTSSRPSSGTTQHIEAESYSNMSGIETESCFDNGGGLNVDWINGGDWMDYNVNVPSSGTYTFNFRLATSKTGQQFQLKNTNGDVLTTVNVPNTGGFQVWQTASVSVYLPAGNQTLRIYSLTQFWNINWFEFSNGTAANSVTGGSESAILGTESLSDLNAAKISVSVFPNPVREKFILNVNNALRGTMQVQIIDQGGQVRKAYNYTKNQNATQVTMPASELPAGTYYIRVQVGKWHETSKLIKL